jgi:hypothetical protein
MHRIIRRKDSGWIYMQGSTYKKSIEVYQKSRIFNTRIARIEDLSELRINFTYMRNCRLKVLTSRVTIKTAK